MGREPPAGGTSIEAVLAAMEESASPKWAMPRRSEAAATVFIVWLVGEVYLWVWMFVKVECGFAVC